MNNLNRYTLYIQNMIDIVVLTVSFWFARFLKFNVPAFHGHDFSSDAYWKLYFVVIISYMLFDVFILVKEDILHRDKIAEIKASFKMVVYIVFIMTLFAFFTRSGTSYSRSFAIMFALIAFVLDFIARIFVRSKIFPFYQQGKQSKKTLLVGPLHNVQSVAEKLNRSNDWRYQVVGAIVVDQSMRGEYVSNVKVISDLEHMLADIQKEEVDSIFLVPDQMNSDIAEWVNKFCNVGKDVHVNIVDYKQSRNFTKVLDTIDDFSVITYLPVRPFPKRQAFVKKTIDIVVGLCLLPLFLIVYILSFLITNLESKGPILYRRVRISKNGRRFYQYRFRMLRMDAKKRRSKKKTPFTRFGLLLRLTHLDGLPMILNVLSGDMSIVGPHSPTLPSYIDYEPERRKNLSVAAGIVGYWSLSEEKHDADVVADERDYIENWSLLKDISIVAMMIFRYLSFHSSKRYRMVRYYEEEKSIIEYNAYIKPLSYDHTLYTPRKNILEWLYLLIKRLFDILVSLLCIVVLSPLLLVLSILVLADDGGSPFYGHSRIGKNGKRIKVYKFRSMKKDAGDLQRLLSPEQLEQYRSEFKIDNDPRITKIGAFIRKTSLDELPQLFNILFGQLSIVGPRPIVEKETLIYGDDIGKLLSVKPGLTGYWQAYARNNATYESGERQEMEMYYVEHHGFVLDVKIIGKTFASVVKKEGAQ